MRSKINSFLLIIISLQSIDSQRLNISVTEGLPTFVSHQRPYHNNYEFALLQISINFTKFHDSSIGILKGLREEIKSIAKKNKALNDPIFKKNLNFLVRERNFLKLVNNKIMKLHRMGKIDILSLMLSGSTLIVSLGNKSQISFIKDKL